MSTVKALVIGGGWGGAVWKTAALYWPWWAGWQVKYESAFSITPGAKTVTIWVWWASIGTTLDINGNDGSSSVFDSITASGWVGWQYNTGTWWSTSSVINGTTTNYTGWTAVGSAVWWGAGAWANGGNAVSSSRSGSGWQGYQSSISGTATYYGGGWGGSEAYNPWTWWNGGWWNGATNATNGTGWTNWLGWWGWGATSLRSTPKWWDGIVIISYATDWSDGVSNTSTGGTITTSGWQTIHTFTTSGTFTMVASTTTNSNFFMFF